MIYRHPHPINIFENMSRFLFLLIIPLIRGFFTFGGGLQAWLQGAWLDVMIVAIILFFAVIRWRFTWYAAGETGISVERGILIKQHFFIPFQRVSALTVVADFLYRPFHATKLRADTDAGFFRKSDLQITLPRDEAFHILNVRESFHSTGTLVKVYQPKWLYIAVLSFLTSNSLTGVIFLSTFISQLGSLLGKEIEDYIYGTLTEIARVLAFGIPPVAAVIAYIIIGGWGIAFIRNLLNNRGFTVTRKESTLYISTGLLTQKRHSILASKINFVDIRQQITTKIFGICTTFIHSNGYGKDKDEYAVFMPASSKRANRRQLALLLPEIRESKVEIRPNMGAIFRYLWEPGLISFLILGFTAIFALYFRGFSRLIAFSGFMLSLPFLWWLVVRILDFCTTGVGFDGNCYTLKYSKGFILHTVIIPVGKAVTISIRQSPIQKFDDACDLILYSYSENGKSHRIKNINRKAVEEYCHLAH